MERREAPGGLRDLLWRSLAIGPTARFARARAPVRRVLRLPALHRGSHQRLSPLAPLRAAPVGTGIGDGPFSELLAAGSQWPAGGTPEPPDRWVTSPARRRRLPPRQHDAS